MGEGAYSKPIYLGRYIVLYAILLYYVAFCSVSTIHFVFPFTLRVMHIGWLIFIDKRWNVLAILLCVAAFVRYIFKSNKEYSTYEVEDLPSQSSCMAFDVPSYPPLSPSSSSSRLLSPPSSQPSSFTSPRSSLSPSRSSLQSSPRSSFSSSPPPAPPPFKMRPRKREYVRMASNASLSSEDSGDSDIDSKAEKFIAQFRSRLKFEKESDSVCE